MKRYLFTLIGLLIALPLTVANAFGLTLNDFKEEVYRPDNLPAADTSNITAETKVNDIINFAIDLILYASGSVAVLMLIYGGIRFITSAGNSDEKDKAVTIIKWSASGLFVVILAFAIVTNIIDLIFKASS